MRVRCTLPLLLKTAALAVVAGVLGVVIARLEARRPIVELERAGATVVVDFDGRVRSVSFCSPAANDRHLYFISRLETLTSVTLARSSITAEGLRQLANLPELRSIDISETRTAGGSLAVLSEFPALRTLQVRRCAWVTDAELAAVQGDCDLENLMLLDADLTGIGLNHFSHFPHLRQLGLDECRRIDDDALAQLLQLTELEELSLDRCALVTADGLAQLAALERLQQLSARGIPMRRDDVRGLAAKLRPASLFADSIIIPEVQPLLDLGAQLGLNQEYEVVWVDLDARSNDSEIVPPLDPNLSPEVPTDRRNPDSAPAPVDDAALSTLALTPEIDTLFLREVPITDDGLKQLQCLRSLEWLVLDGVDISDDGLRSLGTLPRLQRLWLRYMHLHGDGLAGLRSPSRLTELALYSDALTVDGIEQLQQLPELESLVIGSALPSGSGRRLAEMSALQELAIVQADVSVEDVRDLASAPHLQRLQFIKSRIAPQALEQLQPLGSLLSLHLGDCEFDRSDLRNLLACRPELTVSGARLSVRDMPDLFPERQQLLSGIPLLGPRPPATVH